MTSRRETGVVMAERVGVGGCTGRSGCGGKLSGCGLLHSTASRESVEHIPNRFSSHSHSTPEMKSRQISRFSRISHKHIGRQLPTHKSGPGALPAAGVTMGHHQAAPGPPGAASGPPDAPNGADLVWRDRTRTRGTHMQPPTRRRAGRGGHRPRRVRSTHASGAARRGSEVGGRRHSRTATCSGRRASGPTGRCGGCPSSSTGWRPCGGLSTCETRQARSHESGEVTRQGWGNMGPVTVLFMRISVWLYACICMA